MPLFLASYDLQSTSPDPHSEFLKQAAVLGWQGWIKSNQNIWYRLPNTTLEGTFPDQAAALKAFLAIGAATQAQGYRVVLEKYVVVEYHNSNFNSDIQQPA